MPGITVLPKPRWNKSPSTEPRQEEEASEEQTDGEEEPPTTEDVDMAEDQFYPEHMRKKKYDSQEELLRKFEFKHEYDKSTTKAGGTIKPTLNKKARKALAKATAAAEALSKKGAATE